MNKLRQDILILNLRKKVNKFYDSLDCLNKYKFVFQKEKRELANILPGLHFYGMIILVKKRNA